MNSLACVLAITAVQALAPQVDDARPLRAIIQDDALLLHRGAAQVQTSVRRMREAGADTVRITAGWSALAPEPASRRRPAFDATDSAQYPPEPWLRLDQAIRMARQTGLDVMLDVAFWAPAWAVERPIRAGRVRHERWRPSPVEFGQFAEAVARRYSGGFPDPERPGAALPAVRIWTTWNEPNHPTFLLPQWERTRGGDWQPVAPHVYRRLHETAYEAIKRVSLENTVLIGGLAGDGDDPARGPERGIEPLRFVRELACVDEGMQRLTRRECHGFRPLRADGFAHHPYSFKTAPDSVSELPDRVRLGDIDRLGKLLHDLQANGRFEVDLPIWITEYGYESNPPDTIRGISPEQHARYLGTATWLAYRRPNVRSFAQFLLNDIGVDDRFPEGSPRRYRTYQTGLYTVDGEPKPALQGFRLPFHIDPRIGEQGPIAIAFGQVRAAGGGRQRVAVEELGLDGVWRAVQATSVVPLRPADRCDRTADEFLTDDRGFYRRVFPYTEGRSYRARWSRPDGTAEFSVPIEAGPPSQEPVG